MILVSGDNSNLLLGKDSNNISAHGSPVISPPLDLPIDTSSLLSYSIYYNHSLFITNDGSLHGIGDNRNLQISISLPKEKILQTTEFSLKKDQSHQLVPISAVCGRKYTLFMASDKDDSNKKYLIYSSKNIESQFPHILNVGNRIPISLYGGRIDSAAIESEGGIIFIPGENSEILKSVFVPTFLPGGEKAINVACCDKYIFALSSSGRLYQSFSRPDLEFSEVTELNGIVITDISGTWFHCLALSKNGRVFGYGENYCGQLGLGKEIGEVNKFREIDELKNHKISAVYAGGTHSLFRTSEGKVLACGCNFYGQLLLESGPSQDKIYYPIETIIDRDATFCIAGDSISIVFLNSVPKNNPNMTINHI